MNGKKNKTGPIKKAEYDSIPFKNKAIDTMLMNMKRKRMNIYNKKVKDVEVFDPKTGKSKMIYKPATPPNGKNDKKKEGQ